MMLILELNIRMDEVHISRVRQLYLRDTYDSGNGEFCLIQKMDLITDLNLVIIRATSQILPILNIS